MKRGIVGEVCCITANIEEFCEFHDMYLQVGLSKTFKHA